MAKVLKRIFILIVCGFLSFCILEINNTRLANDIPEDSTQINKWIKPVIQNMNASQLKEEPKKEMKKISGLVNVKDIDDSIVIDLRYATENNFTGKVIYSFKTCLLREDTALKLKKANEILKNQGYTIKIYDGYRPSYAQEILWNVVSDPRYVANPKKGGSIHSKGGAVDLTMVLSSTGEEVEMPSGFDDFTGKAARDNKTTSEDAKKNLDLLTSAMTSSGFRSISNEWWHYDDINYKNFSIVEVDPKLFEVDQR